jgi:hypothetical protein
MVRARSSAIGMKSGGITHLSLILGNGSAPSGLQSECVCTRSKADDAIVGEVGEADDGGEGIRGMSMSDPRTSV